MSKHDDSEKSTSIEEVIQDTDSGKDQEVLAVRLDTSDESDSMVINKGKASLLISGADEARHEANKPKALIPEPRVVSAKIEEPETEEVETQEVIQRLENQIHPGKERIKVEQAKFEKLEKRPDEAEIQEEQWGNAISSGWWVTIAGISAVVILLGGLALESWLDGDEAQTVEPVPAFVDPNSDPHEGSPEKWFHDRAGRIGAEARTVLQAFIKAGDDKERSQWVRFPDRFLQKSKLRQIVLSPRLGRLEEQAWAIDHTGDTAFVVLNCKDDEFLPFRAYFTREGEQLKLDWDATVAWCDCSLQTIKEDLKARQNQIAVIRKQTDSAKIAYGKAVKLREEAIEQKRLQELKGKKAVSTKNHTVVSGETLQRIAVQYKISVSRLMKYNQMTNDQISVGQKLKIPSKKKPTLEADIVIPAVPVLPEDPIKPPYIHSDPTVVRCMLRRRDEFYAGPYNDIEHSAFMLISADNIHYMWGYTQRDSALDLELRRILDHGRFVVDLKKDIRVTLRVKRDQKDALPSQLELVEIVHPEWVTP